MHAENCKTSLMKLENSFPLKKKVSRVHRSAHLLLGSVAYRIMTVKGCLVLILRMCEYITLCCQQEFCSYNKVANRIINIGLT